MQLKPDLQKFIEEQLKSGRFGSAEEVIEAGLATLEQKLQFGDFTTGELDRLLAEGESDIECGNLHDGESVFQEIDELSAQRRRAVST